MVSPSCFQPLCLSSVSGQSPPIVAQRRFADHAEDADVGATPRDRPNIQDAIEHLAYIDRGALVSPFAFRQQRDEQLPLHLWEIRRILLGRSHLPTAHL